MLQQLQVEILQLAAEQIQRSFSAGIGAADLFREKGVRRYGLVSKLVQCFY
jgi:hypothetical protein